MNASDLSTELKSLLSIRAVLNRAGINESSYYTAAHRGTELSTENREKIRRALLDTASDLKRVADSLK